MYFAEFLLGNTSSGIIEAASFNKYVVNVGDRQKGRLQSKNIFNVEFYSEKIIEKVNICLKLNSFNGENIYYQKGTAERIVQIIKYNEKL